MNVSIVLEHTNVSILDDSTVNSDDLSNHVTMILTLIIYTGICQTIDVCGIVTNFINIICFVKQGFNEPINISLLCLAISDLGCLVTLVWINVSVTLSVLRLNLPFSVLEVLYLVAGKPHNTFSRITSWITCLITVERCLCIIAPLKVKDIVTPKRVTITLVSVFVFLMSCEAPVYVVNKLTLKFYPGLNITLLGIVSTEDREEVEKVSFTVNDFFLPFTAFIIIIICTFILVISLQGRANWQKKVATVSKGDLANRNQKVAKMVVMVSALFISCFIPVAMVMLAMAFVADLKFGGKYMNISTVVCGVVLVLESINSSTNIVIYYHMSRNYRDAFRSIFCTSRTKDNRHH